MTQPELDLDDRQLVRHAISGDEGRLDHIIGNIAFVKLSEVDWLVMWAVKNTKPADEMSFLANISSIR